MAPCQIGAVKGVVEVVEIAVVDIIAVDPVDVEMFWCCCPD